MALFFNRQAYVHIAGYVASIISPYIVDLVRTSHFSPFVLSLSVSSTFPFT